MSREKAEEKHVKRMADLLRQGSALTQLACPACSSPIFRLKDGTLWCAKCEKKVIVVKEGDEPTKMKTQIVLDTLEETLLAKVQAMQDKMQHEENVEELHRLSRVLSQLLDGLDKLRRTKKN